MRQFPWPRPRLAVCCQFLTIKRRKTASIPEVKFVQKPHQLGKEAATVAFASIREILQTNGSFFSPAVFSGQQLRSLIWEALDETDTWHKRQCALQAPIVFCGVLAMTIFRPLSIVSAFKQVLDALRGLHNVPLRGVTDEAIYKARGRMTEKPFQHVARALGARCLNEGANFFGLIPCAIDGVKLSVADTLENADRFGRPRCGRGDGAFPQVAGVALLHVESRRVIDCVWGHHKMSEIDAARELVQHLGPRHVLFVDRLYTSVDFWLSVVLDKRSHLVQRLSAVYVPRIKKRQGKGDSLIEVHYRTHVPSNQPRQRELWKSKTITMRLIEYCIGNGERVRLITDLLNPKAYPARQLALGYHQRWDIEMAYDEWQSHLATVCHGTQHTVFRSQTPDGVLQEAWALLVAYNLLRGLMVEAGRAHDVRSLDVSFVETLDSVRRAFPVLQRCTSQTASRILYARLLRDIADGLNRRPRRRRVCPRVVKVKMSKFPVKRKWHRSKRHDFARKLRMVDTVTA